jgi:GTP pyrophosphokinase
MAALRKAGAPEVLSPESQQKIQKKKSFVEVFTQKFKRTDSAPKLVIGGESDLAYRFATCCTPEMGKPLVAYKSRGLQFVVHEAQCDELSRLNPDRMFAAHFLIIRKVKVHAQQRLGALRDCTDVFATLGISILDVRLQHIKGDGVTIHFELGATRIDDYEKVDEKLRHIHGISDIEISI